jgi:hypothetical protein
MLLVGVVLLWACDPPTKQINILDERCLMISDDISKDNGLVVPDRGLHKAITIQAWVFRTKQTHAHNLEGRDTR